MSPKRSNGTIMSAAVFEIAGSACFACATRRLTPAGTASRSSANAAARERLPGSAISVSSSTPRRSRSRQKRTSGESGAEASPSDSSSASHEACEAAAGSSRSISSTTAAPDGSEISSLRSTPSSRITAIDRASMCSMAAISMPRGSPARQVSIAASRNSPVIAIARSSDGTGTNARHKAAGKRRGPERHLDDHAERAFGSDEEIDEIHARRDEIPRRSLRHVRHANVIRQPDDAIARRPCRW